jgi:hypothetical protein
MTYIFRPLMHSGHNHLAGLKHANLNRLKNKCFWISVTFEHERNFYIAELQIYYIAIVNATKPRISVNH